MPPAPKLGHCILTQLHPPADALTNWLCRIAVVFAATTVGLAPPPVIVSLPESLLDPSHLRQRRQLITYRGEVCADVGTAGSEALATAATNS
jgi:hypothetical protein